MPSIAWTRKSREDLRTIRDYIRLDSPQRATQFVERLIASTARLKKHPLIGELVTDLPGGDVRQILHGTYRILYRVERSRVSVLRVYHAARLLDDLDVV
jgi:toxin ParE1/3/4